MITARKSDAPCITDIGSRALAARLYGAVDDACVVMPVEAERVDERDRTGKVGGVGYAENGPPSPGACCVVRGEHAVDDGRHARTIGVRLEPEKARTAVPAPSLRASPTAGSCPNGA